MALLDLRTYRPDSWRKELRRCIQNWKGLGSNPGSWWPWAQVSIKHSDKHEVSDTATWEWSKVSSGAVNSLTIRFAWGIGNFVCCFVIVLIFMGLGSLLGWAYTLGGGEDFEVIIWWANNKGMVPFLCGKLTPQETI